MQRFGFDVEFVHFHVMFVHLNVMYRDIQYIC